MQEKPCQSLYEEYLQKKSSFEQLEAEYNKNPEAKEAHAGMVEAQKEMFAALTNYENCNQRAEML